MMPSRQLAIHVQIMKTLTTNFHQLTRKRFTNQQLLEEDEAVPGGKDWQEKKPFEIMLAKITNQNEVDLKLQNVKHFFRNYHF